MIVDHRPRPSRIAFLGWGSLLWDRNTPFAKQVGPWRMDGPSLPLEFSRISARRDGALTLVIDPRHGAPCRVACAESRRALPVEAVTDLRDREETQHANIGFALAAARQAQGRHPAVVAAIQAWARAHRFDAVVWTDLAGNFEDLRGEPWTVDAALDYTRALEPPVQIRALDYVRRAPEFVVTPFRTALEAQPWYRAAVGAR